MADAKPSRMSPFQLASLARARGIGSAPRDRDSRPEGLIAAARVRIEDAFRDVADFLLPPRLCGERAIRVAVQEPCAAALARAARLAPATPRWFN